MLDDVDFIERAAKTTTTNQTFARLIRPRKILKNETRKSVH
jgi:hypothetical protein